MFSPSLWLQCVQDPTFVWGVIAGGFLVLGVALLLLMLTRLGQSNPLRKCVILSLAAHMLLAAVLSTVHVATTTNSLAGGPKMRITRIDGLTESPAGAATAARAWDRLAADSLPGPALLAVARLPLAADDQPRKLSAGGSPLLGEASYASALSSPLNEVAPKALTHPSPERFAARARPAEEMQTIAPSRAEAPQPMLLPPVSRFDSHANAMPAVEPKMRSDVASLLAQPRIAPQATDSADASQPAVFEPAAAFRPQRPAPGNRFAGDASGDSSGAIMRESSADVDELIGRQAPPLDSFNGLAGVDLEVAPAALAANREQPDVEVPSIYRGRIAPDRALRAQEQGGSLETEAAVNAALAWLAANQSDDGRWEPRRHGGGREDKTLGQDRGGAGAKADTGISGLALLAFLGAGHTHLDGDHRRAVARGLEFLLHSQAADGNLGGEAELYAFMYCHGMATIALSEAYALTRDERLEQPLRRAVRYTISAQHPTAGGWRYRPQDKQGDTSLLGWQLMALKSAKLAGIDVPRSSEEGMQRFLRSVAAGKHGGLACYRVNERESVTMTAEALVCRNFLGMAPDDEQAAREAGNYILQALPGSGRPNFYYWYYGTLAMHQLQGDYWQQWNDALRKTLLDSQMAEGANVGSWDVNSEWAGYGGRVFTTSLGALCLEVYYRFLPLYDREASLTPMRR